MWVAFVIILDPVSYQSQNGFGIGQRVDADAVARERFHECIQHAVGLRAGHALVDRRLYLLKAWAGDETRRAKTHVSEAVCFATKPTMARGMIAGRLDEGTPCRCVLADAVYGSDRWMLARRSRHDPGGIAYYSAFAPAETSLDELAAAVGLRWTIDKCFLRAKDKSGLNHCEARSGQGRHRQTGLAMVVVAFLSGSTAAQSDSAFGKPNKTSRVLHENAA